jgi:N-acylneuraminate cytidylyltransferase
MNDIIAFIPARAGSKGIPGKAWKMFCGKPLIYWSIEAARNTPLIDQVVISTDSTVLKSMIAIDYAKYFEENPLFEDEGFSMRFFDRKPEHLTDDARLDPGIVDFAEQNEFDFLVLIQPTNPFVTFLNLQYALCTMTEGEHNSLLSVVEMKRFIWKKEYNKLNSVNYQYQARPNRQEMREQNYFLENGSFYITKRKALLESENRLSQPIGLAIMPEYTQFEIDEPRDWELAEKIFEAKHGTTK